MRDAISAEMIMKGVAVGPVEKAVREDVEALGDLVGVEPSLSEMAYRLAREIDGARVACEACGELVPGGEDSRQLAQLNRELRATLAQLLEGRPEKGDDDDLGDLADPE